MHYEKCFFFPPFRARLVFLHPRKRVELKGGRLPGYPMQVLSNSGLGHPHEKVGLLHFEPLPTTQVSVKSQVSGPARAGRNHAISGSQGPGKLMATSYATNFVTEPRQRSSSSPLSSA